MHLRHGAGMNAPVTLYREVDALGGTADNDLERGYISAITDVLEILERRGFSEHTDAPPTIRSWDADVQVGKFLEPGLAVMVQAYYAEHLSKTTYEQHAEDYIAAYNGMLASLGQMA
jgi:hypothetical protein